MFEVGLILDIVKIIVNFGMIFYNEIQRPRIQIKTLFAISNFSFFFIILKK